MSIGEVSFPSGSSMPSIPIGKKVSGKTKTDGSSILISGSAVKNSVSSKLPHRETLIFPSFCEDQNFPRTSSVGFNWHRQPPESYSQISDAKSGRLDVHRCLETICCRCVFDQIVILDLFSVDNERGRAVFASRSHSL